LESPEFQLFRIFVNGLEGVTAYRTEWTIYAGAERLAGSIDFVGRLSDGSLVLYDWKRSKELSTKYTKTFRRVRAPLQHLDDCQGMHYRLQLNAYAWMLETYYGMRVERMHVVCTRPDNVNGPFVDDVPRMTPEISSMMALQRSRAFELERMELEDHLRQDVV